MNPELTFQYSVATISTRKQKPAFFPLLIQFNEIEFACKIYEPVYGHNESKDSFPG